MMTKDTKIRDLREDIQRRAALTAQMTRDILAHPDEVAALVNRHASNTVAALSPADVRALLRNVPKAPLLPAPHPAVTVRDVEPRPRPPRTATR